MCRQGCEFDTLLGSYSFPSNRDSCSFFLLRDYVILQSLSITIVYRRLSPAGIQLVFITDLDQDSSTGARLRGHARNRYRKKLHCIFYLR